jgi:hypothetical protein
MKLTGKYLKISSLAVIIGINLILSGCYAQIEPQNRNFIMCMGIDAVGEHLRVSFSFPDLAMLTGTDAAPAEPVQVIEAATLSDAVQQLNASSDKIADDSQMSVILFGDSLRRSSGQMQAVLEELAQEKAIRRTALVGYAAESAEEILLLDDKVNGSIGVFLYELGQNNYENQGYQLSVLQDFLGSRLSENCRVPVFETKEDRPLLAELVKLIAE